MLCSLFAQAVLPGRAFRSNIGVFYNDLYCQVHIVSLELCFHVMLRLRYYGVVCYINIMFLVL